MTLQWCALGDNIANQDKLAQMGSSHAKVCFYLPNAPTLTSQLTTASISEQPQGLSIGSNDIETLITINGNHWRKIFTIMAKISAPTDDWRHYKTQLLTANEKICFAATQFDETGNIHIVCGGEACQALGLNKPMPQSIILLAQQKGVVLTTPYLDYRQYPNSLIEQTRQLLFG